MSEPNPRIMTQEARYGVRLNSVIFPIEIRELRHVLAKNGYELSSVERMPPPPARISFGGDIARKQEITVVVETDSGEIGVVGRSLQEVKESFEELTNVIKSELKINLHENVRFFWYVAHHKIDTGKIPRDEIGKVENTDYISRFRQVLGEDLSSFSIRLCPKSAIPNQENWFDIAIEPNVIDERFYHVGVVFRSSDKSKTETFLKDLEDILLKLIKIIEA